MKRELPEATIIGVPEAGAADAIEARDRFIRQMQVQIPHVFRDSVDIWRQYEIVNQPSMVFVNADGSFDSHNGIVGSVDLLAKAQELLAVP